MDDGRSSCARCCCAAPHSKEKVSRYFPSHPPPPSCSFLILLFPSLQAPTTSLECLSVATATCCTTPASFLAVRQAAVIRKRRLRWHRQAKRAHSALASICGGIRNIFVIPAAPSQRRRKKISCCSEALSEFRKTLSLPMDTSWYLPAEGIFHFLQPG